MRYLAALVFFSGVLLSDAAIGQFSPSRFVTIVPKLRPISDTTGAHYLTQHGLWANLQKGFKSAGDRFGWSIAFGGILEFFSWPGASLGMQGSIEVLSDTRNDIGFNPQGVNWEEGFIYNQQIGFVELSGGYLHRCVHNIDNLQTTNPEARNMQRTLIYGSLTARALIRDLKVITSSLSGTSFSLEADYYLVSEDYRYPEQSLNVGPNVENLIASFTEAFTINFFKIDSTTIYLRGIVTGNIYKDQYGSNAHGEYGVKIGGEAMNMEVFLGGESFDDDGGSIFPRESNFFYLGLRFYGKNIGL
jgi:hypothetical protein